MEIKKNCSTLLRGMATPMQTPWQRQCRHDILDTTFFPLNKSTLDKFKKQVSGKGKRAVSIVYDNAAQSGNEDNDYGDLPRLKKQLIDLSRSPFADNKVGDILAYNEELGDNSILWHHSDIPENLWVIGTNDIASEMSNAASFRPISVGSTFNFGVFDVTPSTLLKKRQIHRRLLILKTRVAGRISFNKQKKAYQ